VRRTTFSRRGGLALRIALVMASFTIVGVAPSGATTTSHSTLRCGTDALSVIWRGTTGGLAGSGGDLFWIRNQGDYSCIVSGYPTVDFYRNGVRSVMNDKDYLGNQGNDIMGVAKLRRPPSVRIAPGGTVSFWIFGNDEQTPCTNANQIVVSLRSMQGWAEVPVPRGWSTWPYCGSVITVNPIVPGLTGSDPARSLRGILI
jgi:Protein of unknown function (DUF4232)